MCKCATDFTEFSKFGLGALLSKICMMLAHKNLIVEQFKKGFGLVVVGNFAERPKCMCVKEWE